MVGGIHGLALLVRTEANEEIILAEPKPRRVKRDTDGVSTLLERLGVELPIVQAGMGGGLARHELAAAVSAAGGLGTIGILAPGDLRK